MKEVRKENRSKFNKLLVLSCVLFFGNSSLKAQIGLSIEHDSVLPVKVMESNFPGNAPSVLLFKDDKNPFTLQNCSKQPHIYSFEHLAIFCKIEVQLEKATKFPVKFRLGDVQYVDKLEGKGTNRY